MADYDFMVVWTPNCMYQPYWVCGSIGCLVQLIYPLLWNEKSHLLPSLGCPRPRNRERPCCGMKNHVYCQVWGALVPIIEGASVADYAFMADWTPNCMYQPYWVHGSKGYLVHSTYTRLNVESKSRIWPSVGYFAQRLKATMRDIHLCRMANISWRICVVVK